MDACVLAADPVVPPDPFQMRHLDEDERHDGEEKEFAGHPPTVSANPPTRNRPFGPIA